MTWTEQEQAAALEVKMRVIRHRARCKAEADLRALRPGDVAVWRLEDRTTPYGHVHTVTAREARALRWRLWRLRLAAWWWGL